MNIYVGNLNPRATEPEIRSLFEKYGQVDSVNIATEWLKSHSRGYGSVEMGDSGEAIVAIEELDGQEWMDNPLIVVAVRATLPKTTVTMEDRHRQEIARIMEQMECPQGFACHQSGFKEMCRVGNLGIDGYVCLKEEPPQCSLAIHFGEGHFCKCPLRVYLCKHLEL